MDTGAIPTKRLKSVDKIWGRELWVTNNELYCGKILHLNFNGMSSLHYHPIKDEVFYIQHGACFLSVIPHEEGKPDGEYDMSRETVFLMETNMSYRIAPKTLHRFWCDKSHPLMWYGCTIVEFSSPHDDKDVVRLEESKTL